ncbi:hypothetical protein ACA910_017934 [Epithemia clementina (nom. ined.)]
MTVPYCQAFAMDLQRGGVRRFGSPFAFVSSNTDRCRGTSAVKTTRATRRKTRIFTQLWASSMSSNLTTTTVEGDANETMSSSSFIHNMAAKATGLSFLPLEAVERAQSKSSNPIEKVKLAKDPTHAFVDVYEYARKIRSGEMTWEEVDAADLDTRLKWVGLLHRRKRTPGQFMMRLRVPNGIVTSDQMRFYAQVVEPYGPEKGVVDITTRANIQLRGITLEDAPYIIDQLHNVYNQTSFQSAMDNVRNMVGSPLAGLCSDELVDTRPYCQALNDLISWDPSTNTRGNPQWGNLPRKFNIAISGSPVVVGNPYYPDLVHTHLNDIGLHPCLHRDTQQVGFNVILGGYLSATRVASAISANLWIPGQVSAVVALCQAVLRIFRDEGSRQNRQKARLMWLVEEYGVAAFRQKIVDEMTMYDPSWACQVDQAQSTVPTTLDEKQERRRPVPLLGVHAQAQPNKVRVGILVPVGRLSVTECRQIADLADAYSNGEIRLTVDQNVLLPNVDSDRVESLLAETVFHSATTTTTPRLKIQSIGLIEGHVVSCTGAEFCGLALIETKEHAERLAHKLQSLVAVDRPIHIHWTGCPNSCGQVQVADIGLMGAPAKLVDDSHLDNNGKGDESSNADAENDKKAGTKVVPGCKIFVRRPVEKETTGGGEFAAPGLSEEPYLPKAVPLDDEYLLPVLVDILKREFGAVDLVHPSS